MPLFYYLIIETVRRSKRNRIKPLEFWKNETVEMKRFSSGVGSILPIPVGVHRSEDSKTPSPKPSKKIDELNAVESLQKHEEIQEISVVDDSLCIDSPPLHIGPVNVLFILVITRLT